MGGCGNAPEENELFVTREQRTVCSSVQFTGIRRRVKQKTECSQAFIQTSERTIVISSLTIAPTAP